MAWASCTHLSSNRLEAVVGCTEVAARSMNALNSAVRDRAIHIQFAQLGSVLLAQLSLVFFSMVSVLLHKL